MGRTGGGYLRIGVTGGIGSGKTMVCRLFERLGRHVIEADALAKTLADTDAGVKALIRRAFGGGSFDPSGRLDRRAMAELVFAHPARLRELNAIIHPAVFKAVDRELAGLPASRTHPYVLIEAALIFETGFDARLDHTIAVQAPQQLRIARIGERDGLLEGDIRRRMRSQMPASAKARRADFVIGNDGSLEDLAASVRALDVILCAMAGRAGQ